jgi:hypothetical protein
MAAVGIFLFTFISDNASWLTHVLPGELLMSIGLALVFVPLSSLALIGVADHDAGVASAMLNTSQQIGGSLGTALLNTFYASAVSSYLASHVKVPADVQKFQLAAFIHGYQVAFAIGCGLLVASAICVIVFINAKRDDLPADAVAVAA